MANESTMNQGPSVPPKAVRDFRSDAGVTADEYLARGKEVWTDAIHRVRNFQSDTKQYVRKNPSKAVFTALAVGFVLALIFRRH